MFRHLNVSNLPTWFGRCKGGLQNEAEGGKGGMVSWDATPPMDYVFCPACFSAYALLISGALALSFLSRYNRQGRKV